MGEVMRTTFSRFRQLCHVFHEVVPKLWRRLATYFIVAQFTEKLFVFGKRLSKSPIQGKNIVKVRKFHGLGQ